MSQPGGVALIMNRHVMALVNLGDAAVPSLIDTIERDRRLTRSVHYWRDFSRHRVVLSVREAALEAVLNILKVRFFESRSTGDNFTSRGEEAAKLMAARVRTYWDEYGHLPFDERMMQVLTDPDSSFRSTREAAANLAFLNERRFVTTGGSQISFGSRNRSRRRREPNPSLAKFEKPSIAEAILAAMDRDLKDHDARPDDQLYDYRRREIEDQYLEPLIHLGDTRIAGELKRRSQAARKIRERRKWANAAHQLGDPEAMSQFARDIEAGALDLPANDEPNTNAVDQPGNVELRGIIQDLARTATPEANRALFAIADPQHPYFATAADRVLDSRPHWSEGEPWVSHPYCLEILRRELDNQESTGGSYRIEGTRLIHETTTGTATGSIPSLLADPTTPQPHCRYPPLRRRR